MFQFTLKFISFILDTFELSKIHEIKKFKSLLKSLQNLAKNQLTSQMKKKNNTEIEKHFLEVVQKREQVAPTSKKPDATYLNAAVANTLYFLIAYNCMTLTGIECHYDLALIKMF